MIDKIGLSRGEILALRRFRSDNDGRIIRGVLERVLDHTRLENETSEANELHHTRVQATKEMIAVLFDAELVTEEPSREES